MATSGTERQTEPLRSNRDFTVVLGGQAISALGDAVTLTAMPLLVLFLTGSGALMGTVAALGLLPNLVLGLPAGALADRWDRRRLMLWSDAGRALLTAAIPVSYWLGFSTITVILIVVVPINALRVLSDAGLQSSIVGLVGRENLARANGYFEATLSIPYIAGPALAGVLVATIGAAETIAVDAASFALSAAAILLVRRPLRAERPAELPRITADIAEGIRFVRGHPGLRLVIAYWSVMAFATAAILPALAYFLTVDRNEGEELFGIVGSVWSAGYLLGSLLAGRLAGRTLGLQLLAGGIGIGLALVLLASASSVPVYLAAGFAIGVALALQLIAYLTLRASMTPDELLGRVGATARTVALSLQTLGFVVGGALIEARDGEDALLAMGVVALGASLLFALSRSLRTFAPAS
jgi:MFS family permease